MNEREPLPTLTLPGASLIDHDPEDCYVRRSADRIMSMHITCHCGFQARGYSWRDVGAAFDEHLGN